MNLQFFLTKLLWIHYVLHQYTTVWVFDHRIPNDSESTKGRTLDCWVRPHTSNYLSSLCRLASRDKQNSWFKILTNQVMEDRDTCGGEPSNLNFSLFSIPSHLAFHDKRILRYGFTYFTVNSLSITRLDYEFSIVLQIYYDITIFFANSLRNHEIHFLFQKFAMDSLFIPEFTITFSLNSYEFTFYFANIE